MVFLQNEKNRQYRPGPTAKPASLASQAAAPFIKTRCHHFLLINVACAGFAHNEYYCFLSNGYALHHLKNVNIFLHALTWPSPLYDVD
jgi:hypothetical protein